MLGIEINGNPTNLPDEETLKGYGASSATLPPTAARKAAYVPLQVEKAAGDNWVHSNAQDRSIYPPPPGATRSWCAWLWLVQALVDICAEGRL